MLAAPAQRRPAHSQLLARGLGFALLAATVLFCGLSYDQRIGLGAVRAPNAGIRGVSSSPQVFYQRVFQPAGLNRERVIRPRVRRDEAGYIVNEDLEYDTKVYCQNLGGTAQLPFTKPAQELADKLKQNPDSAKLEEVISIIDANFEYLPVSFSMGGTEVSKGDKPEISKALSFAILGGIPVTTAAKIIGDEELGKNGWGHAFFPNGLSLIPKDSAFDYDTDPNLLLQKSSTISGDDGWDPNSDVWIP
eukprot:CAMPEP_0184503364 /NCGR_PEP_ID=MMETSP0113_2-20130426/51849_1 /TAXON_ID=91329 /ORGANISM="Norrisiella sphaerica, Strain BC52" /LENGTH=247 /DNA_ID=CAMNT_0026892849 /DNA_START=531 /DNA_END=1274 /DNA_ORIENTATION=-